MYVFFRLSHKKEIRSINRNASLRVAIEFPNLFFQFHSKRYSRINFLTAINLNVSPWQDCKQKCVGYSSNQVFMFTANKSNKEIIIWDIRFQRPFRKTKKFDLPFIAARSIPYWRLYIHICMNFFCRKRNGENLRRKVHYVSFGYSMQCRTAFQFLHNRIDNNILCAVFRSKWQHVSFIYFYHHVVYTAIVFRAYSTPQSNSHNNQKKRN